MSVKTFKYSFKRSIPIMLGFLPVGLAYGLIMKSAGYSVLWTCACSTFVLSGSLQFLMISFFGGGFPLFTIIVLSLLLSSRHLFYGLSFIEKFRSFHKSSRWFLIYTLADENYSLHCSYKQEDGVNEEAAYITTAALVLFYWICFSALGCVIGGIIPFSMEGIDFALTALFAVILLDQMKTAGSYIPVYIALSSSIACILIFGKDNFILPSLIITAVILILLRPKLEPTIRDLGGEVAK